MCLRAHPSPQWDTFCLVLFSSHANDRACPAQALNHAAGLGEEQVLVLYRVKCSGDPFWLGDKAVPWSFPCVLAQAPAQIMFKQLWVNSSRSISRPKAVDHGHSSTSPSTANLSSHQTHTYGKAEAQVPSPVTEIPWQDVVDRARKQSTCWSLAAKRLFLEQT